MLEVRITPQNLRRPPRRNGLIWKRFIRNSNASSTQHKSSYLLHLFKRLGRFGAGPSCLLPLNHHLMYPTFCVSNCPLTLRKRASFHHKKGGVWKIISSLLARDVGIWFLRVWKPNFIGQLWKPESCLTPFVNYIPNKQTNEYWEEWFKPQTKSLQCQRLNTQAALKTKGNSKEGFQPFHEHYNWGK